MVFPKVCVGLMVDSSSLRRLTASVWSPIWTRPVFSRVWNVPSWVWMVVPVLRLMSSRSGVSVRKLMSPVQKRG